MAIIGSYRISGLCTNGLAGGFSGLFPRAPMMTLSFTLPVAGQEPADLDNLPQTCQEKNDNIQLTVFVVDQDGNPVNIRGASAMQLKLLAPDGTTLDRAASFLTSGVDGALQYTTTAGDLTEDGLYQIQAKYTMGGKTQTTRWGEFQVGENIDDA